MNGPSEKLFSYGTLQQESVQLANFNRRLQGHADVLRGWHLSSVRITDSKVLAESGLAVHKILVPGKPADEIGGVVFEITPAAPSENSLGAAVMDAQAANRSASKHGPGQSVKFLAAREHIDNQLYALDLCL